MRGIEVNHMGIRSPFTWRFRQNTFWAHIEHCALLARPLASIQCITAMDKALCARILRHHSLLDAYSVAVGLLPQLTWIGLSLARRYHEFMQGADMVRKVAAARDTRERLA